MNEEAFQRARADTSYRQEFLNSIDLEDKRKYIRKVVYDANEELPYPKGQRVVMGGCAPTLTLVGLRGRKLTVLVEPLSFSEERITTYNDFLSSLIDHEGAHAQEFYESPEEVAGAVVLHYVRKVARFGGLKSTVEGISLKLEHMVLARELRALYAQLNHAQRRGVSRPMLEYIAGEYLEYADKVEEHNQRRR